MQVAPRREAAVHQGDDEEFDDCNAAVAWINSGAYTGEAQPVYKPTAGKIRPKKLPDGTFEGAVDITWAYDAASTADVIVPTWPDMTKADKDAVNKYKAALRAHEVMHFDVTDKIVKALPLTVKATGSDPQDATTNLQASRHAPGGRPDGDRHRHDRLRHEDRQRRQPGRGRRRERPPRVPVVSLMS